MVVALFVSAIVAGIAFRKSRVCTAYMLVVMYMIAAYRTYDADYMNYEVGYNQISNSSTYRYLGYNSFLHFFNDIGLDFGQYNQIFFIIVFILLWICIRLLTENVNVVLAYYMIYPYALDVVQMKSLIAEAFAFISIIIIIKCTVNKWEESKKKNVFIWGIAGTCFIIAILFHFSAIYYLFASLIYLLTRNRQNVSVKVFVLMILLFALMYGGFLVIVMRYANAFGFLSDMDYLSHWTVKSTHFGFLIFFMVDIFLILSCCFNKAGINFDATQKAISNFMLTAMLALPFLYLNMHYSRILRIYFILMYISYSRQERSHIITLKKSLNYFMYAGAIVVSFYYDILTNYENTLGALLTYNSWFN